MAGQDFSIDVSPKGPLRARDKRPAPKESPPWNPTLVSTEEKAGPRVPDDKGKHTEYDPGKREEQPGKIFTDGSQVWSSMGEKDATTGFCSPIDEEDIETIEITAIGPAWATTKTGQVGSRYT
jgi:hypothetical protein